MLGVVVVMVIDIVENDVTALGTKDSASGLRLSWLGCDRDGMVETGRVKL